MKSSSSQRPQTPLRQGLFYYFNSLTNSINQTWISAPTPSLKINQRNGADRCYSSIEVSLTPMQEERPKAFWKTIQSDPALQQKLKGVTDPDGIGGIIEGMGLSVDEQ